jgi:hypothetical protein
LRYDLINFTRLDFNSEPPNSVSQAVGLQACTTMLNYVLWIDFQ